MPCPAGTPAWIDDLGQACGIRLRGPDVEVWYGALALGAAHATAADNLRARLGRPQWRRHRLRRHLARADLRHPAVAPQIGRDARAPHLRPAHARRHGRLLAAAQRAAGGDPVPQARLRRGLRRLEQEHPPEPVRHPRGGGRSQVHDARQGVRGRARRLDGRRRPLPDQSLRRQACRPGPGPAARRLPHGDDAPVRARLRRDLHRRALQADADYVLSVLARAGGAQAARGDQHQGELHAAAGSAAAHRHSHRAATTTATTPATAPASSPEPPPAAPAAPSPAP